MIELEGNEARFLELDIRAIDNSENMDISFSSEFAYKRSDKKGNPYYEVLSHDARDVDLSRLNSGTAPFILEHDVGNPEAVIGRVSRAYLTDSKQCRAEIEFSKNPDRQGVITDVRAGIRAGVSVGYSFQAIEKLGKAKDGVDIYKCRWAPYEITSTVIPVDTSIGIRRAIDDLDIMPEIDNDLQTQLLITERQAKMENENVQPATPKAADAIFIMDYAEKRGVGSEIVKELIKRGATEIEAKEAILEAVEKRQATIPAVLPVEGSNGFSKAPAIISSEKPEFNNAAAFRAAVNRDWSKAGFEREMCQERAIKSNGMLRHDQNIVLLDPNANVRATGVAPVTAGTTAQGKELVGTVYHPEKLVDALWNKTWLDKVGTDTMLGLTGNASFPVISSNATTSWATETGALPAAQGLTTGLKNISPKEMVAKFSMSRQSLIQDVPNVDQKILGQLYNAIAQALDAAALSGASVALSTTGLITEIPVGQQKVQGANGLAPNLASLRSLRKLAVNNAIDVNMMKWLISSSMEETLNTTLKDSANTASGYILNEGQSTLTSNRFISSQNVPSGITKGTSTAGTNGGVTRAILGKWDDFLVAQWGSIAVEFDYATGADNSLVYIRSFSFWDMIIKRLESFYMVPDYIA